MEELRLEIEKLSDEVKKVVRRQDEIQKSVDLLFQDRTILEDLVSKMEGVKEIVVANQKHQDSARDSVRADVTAVGYKVEDMNKTIQDKTVIVKTNQKNLFDKLRKLLKVGEKHA